MRIQQRLDVSPQIGIAWAGLAEEASAISFGPIEGRLKHLPDVLPPVRLAVHDAPRSMSCSWARATGEPSL
jgi:hypothetical protein